jgi:hypothetical protein
MRNYEIGYGKPPKHSQFKRGVCPNPRGRGKRADFRLSDAVLNVMGATSEFRDNGLLKRASRSELAIRRHVAAALNGDVASAAFLLKIREHAEKYGEPAPLIINLINSPERAYQRRRRSGAS